MNYNNTVFPAWVAAFDPKTATHERRMTFIKILILHEWQIKITLAEPKERSELIALYAEYDLVQKLLGRVSYFCVNRVRRLLTFEGMYGEAAFGTDNNPKCFIDAIDAKSKNGVTGCNRLTGNIKEAFENEYSNSDCAS